MIKLSKNTKVLLGQVIPNFAGPIDRTETFSRLAELDGVILSKEFIYPGKLIYVLETGRHYIVTLSIADAAGIKTEAELKEEWLQHVESLAGKKDLEPIDYELPGYENTWGYEVFNSTLDAPSEKGFIPISNGNGLSWRQVSYSFNGDIDAIQDTLIASIPFADVSSIVLNTYVLGLNISTSSSIAYTSTISAALNGSTNDVEYSEYGIISTSDISINFSLAYDSTSQKLLIFAKKGSNDLAVTSIAVSTFPISI